MLKEYIMATGLEKEDSIYLVISRKTDSVDTILHKYSKSRECAVSLMERLALDDLKKERGLNENDQLPSPLMDTIEVEKISEGSTIRYRKDNNNTNQDIIDLIKIERVDLGIVFSHKKRVQTVIKSFQIIKVDLI